MSIKGPDAPIVIVGNKIDADRVVDKVGKLSSHYSLYSLFQEWSKDDHNCCLRSHFDA